MSYKNYKIKKLLNPIVLFWYLYYKLFDKEENMTWYYRLGKTKDGYAVYEYIEMETGDLWTETPVFNRWYETPKEAIEDFTMVLADLKKYKSFDPTVDIEVSDVDDEEDFQVWNAAELKEWLNENN